MTPLQIMGEYFWALIPPLTAIILALVTKEVYISLFMGIFVGGMIYASGNPIRALEKIFYIMADSMGPGDSLDTGNAGILIFILELGILVAMMNKAGGAKAFGNWVYTHVKSRKSAMLSSVGLGCMLFVDDYFNRLTVGTIMQPVNDKFRISRAKSAFIAGTLSVTVCMIVPLSSWASAIVGYIGEAHIEGLDPFDTYLKSIVSNFYPILMILFLIATSALGIDFFGMFDHESTAIKTGDLLCGLEPSRNEEEVKFSEKGTVFDLVLPVLVLITSCCILLLIEKDGERIFATSTALDISGCIAIIFCLILFLPRKLMTLKEYTGCFGTGFRSISDVFIILVFAWGLTGICQALNIDKFITAFAEWLGGAAIILPAVFFLAAMGCAFATGTSWGTFGIMVPIVVPMGISLSAALGPEKGMNLMILTISAVLSGSAFGDQVSPISDVTILAAAACKSNHLGYVKAQMPNALLIAAIAFLSFLISGLTSMIWLGWIIAAVLFVGLITTMYIIQRKKGRLTDKLYKEALAAEAAAAAQGTEPTDKTNIEESEPTNKTDAEKSESTNKNAE